MSNPSIFELERPAYRELEFVDSIQLRFHKFNGATPEDNPPYQLTPEQFVQGYFDVTSFGDGSGNPLEEAEIKLPSIEDIVDHLGYTKEGISFESTVTCTNITKLNFKLGGNDIEYGPEPEHYNGRVDFFTEQQFSGIDNHFISNKEFIRFLAVLSQFDNALGPMMNIYILGQGDLI